MSNTTGKASTSPSKEQPRISTSIRRWLSKSEDVAAAARFREDRAHALETRGRLA